MYFLLFKTRLCTYQLHNSTVAWTESTATSLNKLGFLIMLIVSTVTCTVLSFCIMPFYGLIFYMYSKYIMVYYHIGRRVSLNPLEALIFVM